MIIEKYRHPTTADKGKEIEYKCFDEKGNYYWSTALLDCIYEWRSVKSFENLKLDDDPRIKFVNIEFSQMMCSIRIRKCCDEIFIDNRNLKDIRIKV